MCTSGDEERLGEVEMEGADGAVVLVEFVEESAHAVIPELDDAAVETGEDPWSLRVEAEAFYSVTLRLEFRQHLLLLLLHMCKSIQQHNARGRRRFLFL